MNIQDLKTAMPYLFKANITPFLWGHHGLGKTTVPKEYAKEQGWKFFSFMLGTMSDNGDILGLAEFVKKANGGVATKFAMPEWLADCIEYCEQNPDSGALIFLDEFNHARKDLLSGMYAFTLDKRFHTIELPKNCHLIAAGNPDTEEYDVTDLSSAALMARFCHIKFEPTFQEWVEYAKKSGIPMNIVDFYKNQPDFLDDKKSDFNLPVKHDRRCVSSWARLEALNPPTNIMEQLMVGIIGLERTVAYQQFLKNQDKPLTGNEVLKHEKFSLIEKWSNEQDVTASYLNVTRDNIKDELVKRNDEKKTLTLDEKANFMAFLRVIPKDISYPMIKELNTLQIFRDFAADYQAPLCELTKIAKGIVK